MNLVNKFINSVSYPFLWSPSRLYLSLPFEFLPNNCLCWWWADYAKTKWMRHHINVCFYPAEERILLFMIHTVRWQPWWSLCGLINLSGHNKTWPCCIGSVKNVKAFWSTHWKASLIARKKLETSLSLGCFWYLYKKTSVNMNLRPISFLKHALQDHQIKHKC